MKPITLTRVFGKNARAFKAGKRYIINQGSARSSKTFSVLQLLYFLAQQKKPRLISVVSRTLPHLKRGAIRDFLGYLKSTGQYVDGDWSKGEYIYRVGESHIEFFSVDQASKVYGPARDILFVNECNRIDEETFRQLAVRTRETIFVDFNPTHEFYVHTDYMLRPTAEFIHSTFRDNEYLESAIVEELIEAGKRNHNFQKVFVDGEIGYIEGVVFENWEIGDFDETLPLQCFGQDYGFSNDPSTLVRVGIDNKAKLLYLHEGFVLKGLGTGKIQELNATIAGKQTIVGDRAELRLIKELRDSGLKMVECVKGKGSVASSLKLMQDYRIIVTKDSVNLQKELRNYVWLANDIPIDDYNHCIDAARYAFDFLTTKNTGQYNIA